MSEQKFVGLDVHKDSTSIVVINQDGDSLIQSVVATDAEVISDFLKGLSGNVSVTFEVGNQSNWLYRQIKPLVEKVVVCETLHNKLLSVGNKSDLVDAEKLAQLLRLNSVKEVWQHSAEHLHLKELVRAHENLVSDCVRVMNRLKSIFRSQGIQTDSSLYKPAQFPNWLDKLSEPGITFRAQSLSAELETLSQLRKQAHRTMLRQAKKHPDFNRLYQIPGLGHVGIANLIAQVGDPFRFRSKRSFWKYCGFAVNTRSSADHKFIDGKLQKQVRHTNTRGLTRHYCHRLKAVFKTAAQHATKNEAFSRYYENLVDNGTKPSLAKVSLARKIAAISLSIWKHKSQFDEKREAAAN